MWDNLGPELSPAITVVSAILVVVVLAIALSLRGKIKRTERGNEFLFWGKQEEDDQLNNLPENTAKEYLEEEGYEEDEDEEGEDE